MSDFPQGTWDGEPAFCPICGIVGTCAELLVSVNSLLFWCENGHSFAMSDIAEITNRYGNAEQAQPMVQSPANDRE